MLLEYRIVLPDFPELKRRRSNLAQIGFINRAYSQGIIGLINRVPVFEGQELSIGDVDGVVRQSALERFGVEFTISTDAILAKGFGALNEAYSAAADDLHRQLSEFFFKKAHEAIDEVGNAIDAGGQPMSKDLFLDLFETPEWDFHDNEEPDLESVVIILGPRFFEYVSQNLPAWQSDAEFKNRWDSIVTRKREEWRARESHRRLAD